MCQEDADSPTAAPFALDCISGPNNITLVALCVCFSPYDNVCGCAYCTSGTVLINPPENVNSRNNGDLPLFGVSLVRERDSKFLSTTQPDSVPGLRVA